MMGVPAMPVPAITPGVNRPNTVPGKTISGKMLSGMPMAFRSGVAHARRPRVIALSSCWRC